MAAASALDVVTKAVFVGFIRIIVLKMAITWVVLIHRLVFGPHKLK